MSKTITIASNVEGTIRATVELEFLPMGVIMPDEGKTTAPKLIAVNDCNNRLAAIAKTIEHSLEQQTIEEFERRII